MIVVMFQSTLRQDIFQLASNEYSSSSFVLHLSHHMEATDEGLTF